MRGCRGRATTCSGWRDAAIALGFAIGFVSGCARFTPSMPTAARSGDVELRLQHLRLPPRREMTFESHSTVPHQLRRGWVTVGTRAPCDGGAEIVGTAIDGAVGDGLLPPGAHELSVKFEDRLDEFSLDVVVDLEIDDGACVRAPAISQSLPLDAEKRVVVLGGFGLNANNDVSGYRGVLDFHGGAGGWLGPALLTAQVGIGSALCNEGTCGREANGALKSGFSSPVGVDARFALATGRLNRLVSVGMIGARYAYVPVRLPATNGERRFSVHALQGVLAWGFGDNLSGPFRHLERAISYEVAVPIGIIVDQGAPAGGAAFAAGVEIRMMFHL